MPHFQNMFYLLDDIEVCQCRGRSRTIEDSENMSLSMFAGDVDIRGENGCYVKSLERFIEIILRLDFHCSEANCAFCGREQSFV